MRELIRGGFMKDENIDTEDCGHLHEIGGFTMTFFPRNDTAQRFMKWYDTVFLKQYPNSNDFSLSWDDFDGEPVLEVMAHNPFFKTEALVCLFESTTLEKPVVELKSVVKNTGENLN
jgi:hypothetical protein